MRTSLKWLALLIIIGAIGWGVWFKTRQKPIEVMVKTVTRGTVEETVANTRAGTVDACRRARLSPSIGGQIASLPIEEGDAVKSGELLLELWNEDLKARLGVVEQEAAAAAAQAEASCLSADEAERRAQRATMLFNNQVGSREQTDSALTEAVTLRARCEAARASARMSEAQIALARANLSRSLLHAPFPGVIAKIEGELNEFVTPSPVGVPTPPVIDLIENNCFYVTAPIDEVDGAAVRPGMETRIVLDAYRNRTFAGKVRRIAPYVTDREKQARTVDIEVAFSDPDDFKSLLAGYSADVEIILATRSDTLKVPSEAVMDGDSVYVFAPQEQRVRLVTFEPGLRNWAYTEALSGLEQGQQVVVNVDKPGLQDGAAATIAGEERP